MQPFEKAYIDSNQKQRAAADVVRMWQLEPNKVDQHLGLVDPTEQQVYDRALEIVTKDQERCEVWKNNLYQVAVYNQDPPPADNWPRIIHLSIKRLDRETIHDWRDLQEIKNHLVGAENEAVELYPAESRLVDTANQYHLWVLADPNARWPFGFSFGLRSDAMEGSACKQRPFEQKDQNAGPHTDTGK